jgi:hypothetical protein
LEDRVSEYTQGGEHEDEIADCSKLQWITQCWSTGLLRVRVVHEIGGDVDIIRVTRVWIASVSNHTEKFITEEKVQMGPSTGKTRVEQGQKGYKRGLLWGDAGSTRRTGSVLPPPAP